MDGTVPGKVPIPHPEQRRVCPPAALLSLCPPGLLVAAGPSPLRPRRNCNRPGKIVKIKPTLKKGQMISFCLLKTLERNVHVKVVNVQQKLAAPAPACG